MPRVPYVLPMAALALLALPGSALADSYCEIQDGVPPAKFIRDLGTLYVPRDARDGAIIGQTRRWDVDVPVAKNRISCYYEAGSFPTRAELRAVAPLAPAPANPDPDIDPQRLLQTSVPGIAAQMEYEDFFTNNWAPIDGRKPIPPFDAERKTPNGALYDVLAAAASWVTLVKIGPIAPGRHVLPEQEIFIGDFTAVNKALTYSIRATVIQAQCDAGASGPLRVDLGDWDRSYFKAPGTTTRQVPITLSLTDCQDDPAGGIATVHAEFSPTGGSMPVGDPANGVFSLTRTASAKGVGIQLMQENGNPMPLQQPVQMQQIPSSGDLDLKFGAHLYQTHDSSEVEAGSVDGMLTFTLTYH